MLVLRYNDASVAVSKAHKTSVHLFICRERNQGRCKLLQRNSAATMSSPRNSSELRSPAIISCFNRTARRRIERSRPSSSGPDHGPSGPWGLKATAGPSYIYLQYWPYFSSIFYSYSLCLEMLFMLKKQLFFAQVAPKQSQVRTFYTWNVVYYI